MGLSIAEQSKQSTVSTNKTSQILTSYSTQKQIDDGFFYGRTASNVSGVA